MALTQLTSDIAEYLVTLIDTNKIPLGIDVVYYGDQQKLDAGIVVCVEPDEKVRNLKSATRMTRVEITLQVFVYHSLVQSPITSRRDNDKCAERIEELIHKYPRFGGRVIHCLVTSIKSGVATKNNTLVRASRIEVYCESQAILPSEDLVV